MSLEILNLPILEMEPIYDVMAPLILKWPFFVIIHHWPQLLCASPWSMKEPIDPYLEMCFTKHIE